MDISSAFRRLIQKNCNYIDLMDEVHQNKVSLDVHTNLEDTQPPTKRRKTISSENLNDIEDFNTLDSLTDREILLCIQNKSESLYLDKGAMASTYLHVHLKQAVDYKLSRTKRLRELEHFVKLAKLFKENKFIKNNEAVDKILSVKEILELPLQDIHTIVSTKLIRYNHIFNMLYRRQDYNIVLKNVIGAIFGGNEIETNKEVLQHFLSSLIRLNQNLPDNGFDKVKTITSSLLNEITYSILDNIFTIEENTSTNPVAEIINIYEILIEDPSPKIDKQTLEKYLTNELNKCLTYKPDVKLCVVLETQQKWRSTVANKTLSKLMLKLASGVGWKKCLSILNDVITIQEVNWECVMTLLAIILNLNFDTPAAVKGQIDVYIRQGCVDFNRDLLILGFVLARQASEEGQHIFPLYSHWLSSTFGVEHSTPASTKQAFDFLIKFLSNLVPYDIKKNLKAHFDANYFCPHGCQDILQDYKSLLRARLCELRPQASIQSTEASSSSKSEVMIVVERAVTDYSMCGKVTSIINEMSVFKKPYFIGEFLPNLLTPRCLPQVPDAKMKLIEELHRSSKISKSMYKGYLKSCELLKSNVKQDDVCIQPQGDKRLIEIDSLFNEIVNLCKKDGDLSISNIQKIVSTLSQLSHMIEILMSTRDVCYKDNSVITVGEHLHNPDHEAFTVIKKLLEVLSIICNTNSLNEKANENRVSWLSQLISIITSSATLQCVMFNYLLHSLQIDCDKMSEETLCTFGILFAEMSVVEGIFNQVIGCHGADKSEPTSFILYFNRNISLDSEIKMTSLCYVIGYWLQWFLKHHANQGYKISEETMQLYWNLAPRLVVMKLSTYCISDMSLIPTCSLLYYKEKKHILAPSIYQWLKFELAATWSNVNTDAKQSYLMQRLFEDFDFNKSKDTMQSLFKEIFWFLLTEGSNNNSNNTCLLLLLQTLSYYCNDSEVCLLEQWDVFRSKSSKYEREAFVVSFMNNCRCFSPSLFLKSSKLPKPARTLQQLTSALRASTGNICLASVDVVYILSSILAATRQPSLLEKYVNHLKIDIIYNWKSVKWFFEANMLQIKQCPSLENIFVSMKKEHFDDSFGIFENGMKQLTFVLDGRSNITLCKLDEKITFLKYLLQFTGCKIFKGEILKNNLNEVNYIVYNMSILKDICRKELKYVISIKGMYSYKCFIDETAENFYKLNLSHRLLPISLAYICLDLLKEDACNFTDTSTHTFVVLLWCNFYLCLDFEKNNIQSKNTSVFLKRNVRYSSEISNVTSPAICNVDLLANMARLIMGFIELFPATLLNRIPNEVISRCDTELKEAIKRKITLS